MRITIYDNESQDGTAELAEFLGCRAVSYSTDGELRDSKYMEIKSNCWRASDADWILIVDLDEWVDIRPQDLDAFDAHNVTIIDPQQMILVWENDTLALVSSIPKGLVDASAMETQFYGKTNLFNCHAITDFAICPGGHHVNVSGRLKWLTDIEMPAKSTVGLAPFISRPKRPIMS